MLTERQIIITDFLLKYLSKREGTTSSLDDYPVELRKQGFGKLECDTLLKMLVERLEFIDYVGSDTYLIMLTPEGNKASKIGVVDYFNLIEQDKQLDRDTKIQAIKSSKKALRISIIAMIAAVLVPFIIEIVKVILE